MGTYVYALRSPRLVKTIRLDTGPTIRAASMSYLYKPFFQSCFHPGQSFNRKMEIAMDRLQSLWTDTENMPTHVAMTTAKGHRIKPGDDVYCWPHRDQIPFAVYDDPDYGQGRLVGKVAEVIREPKGPATGFWR